MAFMLIPELKYAFSAVYLQHPPQVQPSLGPWTAPVSMVSKANARRTKNVSLKIHDLDRVIAIVLTVMSAILGQDGAKKP